ncbi:STAS domain-containing protein [Streptomyces sp. C10-9-1]|uniref:STAS domain-containing protein n=1 Tax=Streptomyces sp. C10-9-1 TaxID=1859285 RepID=UPI0027E4D44E|nr:STAS domain-containing protein [Streptomyces sp. C10-9-1]
MDAVQPIVLRITGVLRPADVPRLCEALTEALRTGHGEGGPRPVVDVGLLTRADLTAVDALARLQLTARRHGTALRVRGGTPQLLGLLDLVGLVGPAAAERTREEGTPPGPTARPPPGRTAPPPCLPRPRWRGRRFPDDRALPPPAPAALPRRQG